MHIALIRYILRSAKRLCGENRMEINTIIKFKQYNNNRWQLCKFVGIINCVCVCVVNGFSHGIGIRMKIKTTAGTEYFLMKIRTVNKIYGWIKLKNMHTLTSISFFFYSILTRYGQNSVQFDIYIFATIYCLLRATTSTEKVECKLRTKRKFTNWQIWKISAFCYLMNLISEWMK